MSAAGRRALVFAYHKVGVRGLAALRAAGFEVPLLVTHRDRPDENIWFRSVAELARLEGIPTIYPEDPNLPEVVEAVRACRPDWIFSFYYRQLLREELLGIPARGAFNLHGSLLPRYRGRAPVNWAVLHGERRTGASLHRMEIKPDAGALVDQEAVPILPNDTAAEVFDKVTCAAEQLLVRALPALLAGDARETPLDLAAGSYYGGRRPEDGRIDWRRPAWAVHNLVRAVAPPYPGAFTDIAGRRLWILGSHWVDQAALAKNTGIYWQDDACYADCADARRIRLTRVELGGRPLDRAAFQEIFGAGRIAVGSG